LSRNVSTKLPFTLRKIPKSADIIGMRYEKSTKQIIHFAAKCSVESSSYSTVL